MLLKKIQNSVRMALVELGETDAYRDYTGPYTRRLESELTTRMGINHCLLTSSGTAAIEMGLRTAAVGQGDEVVLSAYDYPGNFWAVERVGAKPVLVDVEANGWRVPLSSIREVLRTSNHCKAVIASHLHGQVQEAVELRQLCDEFGVLLVEDCCQSLGSEIEDPAMGSRVVGSLGHFATLSFGGGKLLSAGRGGALLTQDASLAQRAKIAAGAGSGPYALSETQAAIVLAQLPWLEQVKQHCCEYFAEVFQRLGPQTVNSGVEWAVPCARQLVDRRAGLYQAGFLVYSNADLAAIAEGRPGAAEKLISRLRERPAGSQLALGTGFPGFHRRSERRCRIAEPLVNAPQIVQRTVVVHHRVALEEHLSPQELSAAMASALEA